VSASTSVLASVSASVSVSVSASASVSSWCKVTAGTGAVDGWLCASLTWFGYKMEVCAELYAAVALLSIKHARCPMCSVSTWTGRFGHTDFVSTLLVFIMYCRLYSVKLCNSIYCRTVNDVEISGSGLTVVLF
jgi:hypothetical protein